MSHSSVLPKPLWPDSSLHSWSQCTPTPCLMLLFNSGWILEVFFCCSFCDTLSNRVRVVYKPPLTGVCVCVHTRAAPAYPSSTSPYHTGVSPRYLPPVVLQTFLSLSRSLWASCVQASFPSQLLKHTLPSCLLCLLCSFLLTLQYCTRH